MTNFLILMSDEHNFRVSSVYGHAFIDTPNMHRLAHEGTVFDAAYCISPLCAPCRSAFMSGLPVHTIQAYNNCNVFTLDHPSYGAVLREQDVYTAYVGKTDVYAEASRLGFSEMMMPGDRQAPGDTNFGRIPLSIRADGPSRADGFGVRKDAFARDTRVVDRAIQWLSDRAPVLDSPWTLTVNIGAPHFPHYVTTELWEKYANGGDLPPIGPDAESANHPYAQDLRSHFGTDGFTKEQIRGLRRGYLGGVDYVDSQLGRLLEALDVLNLRADTAVAYTSDHGEMLGKFGMWWKCSMYEDSLRVPLIVSGPGFGQGERIGTPVSLFDLQASLFAATGAERPRQWWGAPLQEVRAGDGGRVAFAEYHGHGTRSGSFMIRKGPWKLLHHAKAPHQLFNLEQDPEELRNLFSKQPDITGDLDAELCRLCSPAAEVARAHRHEMRQQQALVRLTA